ncbi:AMP-binding protein [Mycobacterium syngnathidarum]
MTGGVASALNWWARSKEDQPAIRVGEDALTYRELLHWSSRVARHLVEDLGVRPGDRIGLLSPNAIQWPTVALAVIRAGAVLVPLNARLKPAEVRKTADEAGANVVVAAGSHVDIALRATEMGQPFDVVDFDVIDQMRIGAPDDFSVHRPLDEPIAVIFTSGSTGVSKGVVLTTQWLLNIVLENTLIEAGFRPDTVTLLVLPLAFTPGLVYGLLMTTVLGGILIVEPDLNPSRAVDLIERHSVKALFGVPVIWEAIAKAPEFDGADLSSLETAIVGGAAVSTDLLNRWAAKGVLLRQIYGMTEAGGVATSTPKNEALEHPGSCGSGSIFTQVTVMNDDGTLADPGVPGEIVVRGPLVTPGYWNDPHTTAAAIRDGWLHSGDVGVSDPEGRITFVDRLKDIIISGGINISPIELEQTIAKLDGVVEVSVIAVHDERWGETPAAVVVVSGGRDVVDEATITAHCADVLSDYKVPRYVALRSEPLPRQPSGKIDKQSVREQYRDIPKRLSRTR